MYVIMKNIKDYFVKKRQWIKLEKRIKLRNEMINFTSNISQLIFFYSIQLLFKIIFNTIQL